MQLHWMGALLVVAGCGGIGFLMALYDRKAFTALEQLARSIAYMQSELTCHLTPLPELCRMTARQCKGCVAVLFSTLAGELESQISPDVACCMAVSLGKLPELPQKAREALTQLGTSLGRFDLEGQLRELEGCLGLCHRLQEEMAVNRTQRLRSYQTLGLCAGAALAILFL